MKSRISAASTGTWSGTVAVIAASIALIVFGIGAVATGFSGRDQVRSNLAREQIVGTPDSSIPGP